jgi:hypothetical protein
VKVSAVTAQFPCDCKTVWNMENLVIKTVRRLQGVVVPCATDVSVPVHIKQ